MSDYVDRLRAALQDRYAVDREVGAGGMASVYLAEDLKHGRSVAIKVLRPDLAAALGSDRFLREIEIAARLQHPHILPLYDSGEADGFLYYAMPYVEGESLRGRIDGKGEMPIPEAIRLLRDVADALTYAHGRGVIHRDIKPENVMLSGRHGLVTDFGVAKAVSEATGRHELTTAGVALGTPTYMSPEQASAEPNIDHRCDIYALGAVGYELLAGQPPFTGSTTQAILAAHVTRPPQPITDYRATISPALAELIMKCLEKSPADRWQSADEILDRLEGLVTPSAGVKGTKATPVSGQVSRAGAQPARSGKTVAVLPFANMSADPENEYFSDGITEELINALSKLSGLQVVSRTTSFGLKGRKLDVRDTGRELGVSTVLEGSVRKAGNRIRITAQLINVADDYQLWSDRYDREMEDVFAIQEEIADSIVQALRVVLSEDEKRAIVKAPTANVQAYDYYLRGRQFFHQFRKKSLEFARQMFVHAIDIDPDYALAYAGVADCCSYLYQWWDHSDENLAQANAASRKALELDPDSAEAHTARGVAVSLGREYEEADRQFEKALRLNPKLYEAYYFYGRGALQQGKPRKALELFERAAALRPEDYHPLIFLAQSYKALNDTEREESTRRRALEVIKAHLHLNPDDARAVYLGASSLAKLGEQKESLEWARRARVIDPEDAGVLYNVACVYATLGQKDDAISCLEEAISTGFGHKEWMEQDPDFNSIRDDSRFQALLKKL